MPDLTHVRVNVSPTAQRVRTRREHDALVAAARRPRGQEPPTIKPDAEEES